MMNSVWRHITPSNFRSPIISPSVRASHSFPPNQIKRRTVTMASAKPQPFKIILGSSSKARKEILTEMGYEFEIKTADIDEKAIRKEKPEDLVMALAEAKANAIMSTLQNRKLLDHDEGCTLLITADTAETIISRLPSSDINENDAEPTLLITADQDLTSSLDHSDGILVTGEVQNTAEVVVYDGAVREKPSSKEEAREFIKGYSGGHAATVGSVLVTNLKTGTRKGGWDKVEIYFHDIPNDIMDKLIEEGDVLYVAGGLIIEHPLILPLVKEVVGTTDSVMGLPKALTEELIKQVL